MICFEDLEAGNEDTFGPLTVTSEAIIRFAEKYDPQPFHLSDEGAEGTIFGSLAASGWHTAAMTMKLIIDRDEPLASLGSPGLDDLRWHRPVYPGDELTARIRVLDKRTSESRADMGIVRFDIETYNQHDDIVMSYTSIAMIARRAAADDS